MIESNVKNLQSDSFISCNQNRNKTNSLTKKIGNVLHKKRNTKTKKLYDLKYNITEGRHRNRSKLNCKNMLSSFLSNSSIYILNRIGKSTTSVQKIGWSIILLLGIIGFLSQVAQFLESYYSYPVLVNLDSISTKVQVFPAVTVCNVNIVRRQFEPCIYKNLNYEECTGENEVNVTENFDDKNNTLPECNMDLSNFPSRNITLKSWVYLLHSQRYDSRVKYGHRLEDFIQYCEYSAKICTSKHFQISRSLAHGNCYTFNTGEQKLLSTEYGPLSGLILELNLETEKYATFTRTVGAKVQIHDPYLNPTIDSKGIYISPGFETHIAVTKSAISRLPAPYKDNCKQYNLGDSQANCQELCMENITMSLCSCSIGTNLRSGIRECDLTDPLIWCCLAISERYLESCYCPLACEESKYDIQISRTLWPSRTHFEKYKQIYIRTNDTDTLSYEKFRENRLKLKVFYDNLDYIVYQQSAMYQSSQIFSQVGGQMGLWLGMSLVFIFECLETIYFIFRMRK